MNKNNIWFTSDTHWQHKNIIKYCNRPFEHTHDHDKALIKNWNSVVPPDGHVFHLGDFGFGSKGYMINILRQLNGKIYLIKGNHDKAVRSGAPTVYFEWIKDYHELTVVDEDAKYGKQKIILCHYAFQVWNKSRFGSWCIHGHSHHTLSTPNYMRRLDVGVDGWDYTPVSYGQIKEHMDKVDFKPIDHHEKRK